MTASLADKHILLIIGGGIAAYKSLDLIRRLRERGAAVRCVLTRGGEQFVTPLALSALSAHKVFRDLFDLTDEAEMGHIQLSRAADLLVVAPATADLLARMAAGLADDLAATVLLATDTPVLVAPAMNNRMWDHPATQRNLETLAGWGVRRVGPAIGEMACGEHGPGRMAEPLAIVAAVERFFTAPAAPLAGRRAIVTSGPTREALDPVRYLSNQSSGKQGHAIAAALADLGADVTLVSGPVALADPPGVTAVHIDSAREMLAACQAALPADIAVCAAAVSDWRPADAAARKMKKDGSGVPPALTLVENPDILAHLSKPGRGRPTLVVGFAAETDDILAHARTKRTRKGCDWIVANDVSAGNQVFGSDTNKIYLIDHGGVSEWPVMTKTEIARQLADRMAGAL